MGHWRSRHRSILNTAISQGLLPQRQRAFFKALGASPIFETSHPPEVPFFERLFSALATPPFCQEHGVLRFLLRCASNIQHGLLRKHAQACLIDALETTTSQVPGALLRGVLNLLRRDGFAPDLRDRARGAVLLCFRRASMLSPKDIEVVTDLRDLFEPASPSYRALNSFLTASPRVSPLMLRQTLRKGLNGLQISKRVVRSHEGRIDRVLQSVQLEKSSLRRLSHLGEDQEIPVVQRLEALMLIDSRSSDRFLELLEKLVDLKEVSVDVIAFVLELGLESELEVELMRALFGGLRWMQRRACARLFADPKFAHMVPMLVSVGVDADPMTQLALLETFEAIGHMSAEPYVVRALTTSEDPGVQAASVRSLEVFGTRLALPALHALTKRRPSLREDASRAIDVIQARYPAVAGLGALTLSREDATLHGALSELGARAADIELYEDAVRGLEQGIPEVEGLSDVEALVPGGHGQLMIPGWELIPTAPRALPPTLYAQDVLWGDGVSAAGWGALLGSIPLLLLSTPIGAIVAMVGVTLIFGVMSSRWRTWRVMRDGLPTYGELVRRESSTLGSHRYTFRFDTLKGPQEVERSFLTRRPEIEDEDQEALMFLESTGEVVLLDELPSLQITKRGALYVPRFQTLALAVSALLFIVIGVLLGLLV